MDHGNGSVVTTGPFAGLSGILVRRRGAGRCLIQMDESAGRLLIEIDEGFVKPVC